MEDRITFVRQTLSKDYLEQTNPASLIEVMVVRTDLGSIHRGEEHQVGLDFQLHGVLEDKVGVLVVNEARIVSDEIYQSDEESRLCY